MKNKARGYSWQLEEGDICCWVEPTKEGLIHRGKPSDNAKVISVIIIPRTKKNIRSIEYLCD